MASPSKGLKTLVAESSPQSLRDLNKEFYARDQSQCKETFKAIQGATTEAEKQQMLDQALEYFMAVSEKETDLYQSKLGSVCQTKEEVQALEQEKSIRKAERLRWNTVKTSPKGVNDMEFMSFNEKFNTYKCELAREANVAYPFTAEQLKSGTFWKDSSFISASDPNEAVFECAKVDLVENTGATKAEDKFTETLVKTDPATLREEVYAETLVIDTEVPEQGAWSATPECAALTGEELGFYNTFWVPTEKFALDTKLDETRPAVWRVYTRTDIIKADVVTKKQEATLSFRASRGPLSAALVNKRINRMAAYFTKHKFVQRRIAAPTATFFEEKMKVMTPEDVKLVVDNHQSYEANFVNALAATGEKFTENFVNQSTFKFASPEAKAKKDQAMAVRAVDRIQAIEAIRAQYAQ